MPRLSVFTALLLAFFCLIGPADRAGAKGKPKPADQETTELHLLERDEGAAFGDWNVWRNDTGGKSLFLINAKTGYAVYLVWSSNGWINYRDDKGDWYLLLSKAEAKKQDRDDLKVERFLKKKAAFALDTGKYTFQATAEEAGKKVTQQWTVKITKTHIDFHNAVTEDRMTIRRNSGEITHNGRSFGGKE